MAAESIWQLHEAACRDGRSSYEDPETGYQVFTRVGLVKRGRCCGAGCRHCPYAHEGVDLERRAAVIAQAAWLNSIRPLDHQASNILFWSGGKDSFLAYRALERDREEQIVLLTTFDCASGNIAHQEIPIDAVITQANQLKAALIGVPLHSGRAYLEHLLPAFALVPKVNSLSFGDLHLAHIRRWREQTFSANPDTRHLELRFPLWEIPYEMLLEDLEASSARCLVSAVANQETGVLVGETFDRALLGRLPDHVDRFGENGEFHTRIEIAG